jgi:hypothetical protein
MVETGQFGLEFDAKRARIRRNEPANRADGTLYTVVGPENGVIRGAPMEMAHRDASLSSMKSPLRND